MGGYSSGFKTGRTDLKKSTKPLMARVYHLTRSRTSAVYKVVYFFLRVYFSS